MKTELPTFSDHTGIRRSGKTTRLIDKYIQELFTGEEIHPTDHYIDTYHPYTSMERMSRYLIDRILKRLEIEHQINTNSFPIYISINRNKLTLQLKLKNDKTINKEK